MVSFVEILIAFLWVITNVYLSISTVNFWRKLGNSKCTGHVQKVDFNLKTYAFSNTTIDI